MRPSNLRRPKAPIGIESLWILALLPAIACDAPRPALTDHYDGGLSGDMSEGDADTPVLDTDAVTPFDTDRDNGLLDRGGVVFAKRHGTDESLISCGSSARFSDSTLLCAGSVKGRADIGPDAQDTATVTSNGKTDVLLARLSAQGERLWQFQAGDEQFQNVWNATVLSDDRVVIAGIFEYTLDLDPSDDDDALRLVSAGGFDVFVALLTGNGTPVWANRIGGEENDYPSSLSVLTDDAIVVGTALGSGELTPAWTYEQTGLVTLFASDGALLWQRFAGYGPTNLIAKTAVSPEDDIYVAGVMEESAIFQESESTETTLTGTRTMNVSLAKYRSNGDLEWAKVAVSGGAMLMDVAVGPNNRVYLGGSVNSTSIGNNEFYEVEPVLFGPETDSAIELVSEAYSHDGYVAIFTDEGVLQTAKVIVSGAGDADIRQMLLRADGRLYVQGDFRGEVTFPGSQHDAAIGDDDTDSFYLARLDGTTLDSDWVATATGPGDVSASTLLPGEDDAAIGVIVSSGPLAELETDNARFPLIPEESWRSLLFVSLDGEDGALLESGHLGSTPYKTHHDESLIELLAASDGRMRLLGMMPEHTTMNSDAEEPLDVWGDATAEDNGLVSVLDGQGEAEWAVSTGASGRLYDACRSTDDRYVVVGYEEEASIRRHLSDGTLESTIRIYCPDQYCPATLVACAADGSLAVAGTLKSENLSEAPPEADHGQSLPTNLFLSRYSAANQLLWTRYLLGDSNKTPEAVALLNDGSIILYGTFRGTLRLDNQPPLTAYGADDSFLARFDANGTPVWIKQLGWTGADQARAMAISSDGTIFIAGGFHRYWVADYDTPGQTIIERSNDDSFDNILIAALDPEGTLLWARTHSVGQWISDIVLSASGDLVVGGTEDGENGELVFVSKFTQTGRQIWTERFLNPFALRQRIELLTLGDDTIAVAGVLTDTLIQGTDRDAAPLLKNDGSKDLFVLGLTP